MTTTPNPTAEQAIAEALQDMWPDSTLFGDPWSPESHEVVSIASKLRTHGLLSEGAPSEEQVERAARALFEDPNVPAEYTWEEMVAEDPSRADIWRDDARRVLTAAGVARREKSALARLNELLGLNIWAEVPSFRADLRIDFDEYGNILAAGVAPQEEALSNAEILERIAERELEAAGAPAPQGATAVGDTAVLPAETPESGNVRLDREKVRAWLQREFGSVLAHDPHNPERFWGGSADALCVAYTEGKLT